MVLSISVAMPASAKRSKPRELQRSIFIIRPYNNHYAFACYILKLFKQTVTTVCFN
jgi:hypothetical protein